MTNSGMNLIRNRIINMPNGSVFVVSDFTDIADYENAKKCLLRLEKEGLIRRIIRGVYDKPYFSTLLNEYAAANIEGVANAIARNGSAVFLKGDNIVINNSYFLYNGHKYISHEIQICNQTFLINF